MSVLIRTLMSALLLAAPAAAQAGGDDYDALSDTEGRGPAYFGFVRDQRGGLAFHRDLDGGLGADQRVGQRADDVAQAPGLRPRRRLAREVDDLHSSSPVTIGCSASPASICAGAAM